jgi:hypothetical protein
MDVDGIEACCGEGEGHSAIHITYRISLRSSSMPEPRDTLLKVLTYLLVFSERPLKYNAIVCCFTFLSCSLLKVRVQEPKVQGTGDIGPGHSQGSPYK